MKPTAPLAYLSFICLFFSFAQLAQAQKATDSKYLFFLHNRFYESHDATEAHPRYGRVEYQQVISAFEAAGLQVISEKRPDGTRTTNYARQVANQVDSLLKLGVAPTQITIVGTSKGGYIAQYVATYAANPALNYVLVGSYFAGDAARYPEINFCGQILNIYERSDRGSASASPKMQQNSCASSTLEELMLETGLQHGFLFKALPDWIDPAIAWAQKH